MFLAMLYMDSESIMAYFFAAAAMAPAAFVFDVFDGRVARARNQHSALGRELDSLADVISFGVVPRRRSGSPRACTGGWDAVVLIYFVCCGVSRLARYNVTAEALSEGGDKVKYFEGTPIPTSVVLVGVLAYCAWDGRIGEGLWVAAGARAVDPASAGAAIRGVGNADDQQDATHPEALGSAATPFHA